MLKTALVTLGVASALVASTPIASAASYSEVSQLDTTGFINPQITYSQGRHAVCISGIVAVPASTNANVHLNASSNLTTDQATQLILDLNTANSSQYLKSITGSQTAQSNTWNISSRLCFPSNTTSFRPGTPQQVQLLTHGVAFTQTYWDFPNPDPSSSSSNKTQPNNSSGRYSYIDYAALRGKITFSYDRLGINQSSHPDPIQTVQGPLELEILYSLTTLLRTGHISNINFTSVIGIGHSYGSALTTAVARKYPNAFTAVVLTGFSFNSTGFPQATAALNLLPARDVDATRFPGLPPAYLVPSTRAGVQYTFFSSPDFSADVLSEAFHTISTTTVGEQATMELLGGAATHFTGPVFVVDGGKDLFFCDGDCDVVDASGRDIPARSVVELFPAADGARSGSFVLSGSGHAVNLAGNAGVAFARILEWVGRV